jgi:hypothetical protein
MIAAVSSPHGHGPLGDPFVGGAVIILIAGGTTLGATQSASSDTAPILAFGAIVIAAVIASWTAITNVRTQIDGEAQRQAASLAHDRKLVDLQHLRQRLDASVTAVEEAFLAQVNAAVRLKQGPLRTEPSEEDRPFIETAVAAEVTLEAERRRIEMRFPPDGAVGTAYGHACDLVGQRMDRMFEVLNEGDLPMSAEQDEADTKLGGDTREALKVFADAARHEIGVREGEAGGHLASGG